MSFREWIESRRRPESAPADPDTEVTREQQEAILRRVAEKVVRWQMTIPAILFLESVKPLNYIGAQAMVFFEPFVQTIFNLKDYDTFRLMMEKRETIERLLLKIEELDAESLQREREARAARRSARRRRWWWPFGSGSTPSNTTPPSS